MNSIHKKMYYIRFCYWLGAIIDGLVAIDMFLYILFGTPIYMKSPIPTQETQYIMTSGATLMVGSDICHPKGVTNVTIAPRNNMIIRRFWLEMMRVSYK